MPIDPADLTKEKSLWAVFLQTNRIKPAHSYDRICIITFMLLMAIYAVFADESSTFFALHIREIADLGFSFSLGILGFLIAGFTIFASITKQEIFIRKAEVIEPNSKLNYLKYTFGVFMKIFIQLFVLLAACVLIKIFAFPNGPATTLLNLYSRRTADGAKHVITRFTVVSLSTDVLYCVLLLKDFIFNIYYSIMSTIQYEMEFGASENQTSA
jgi:hypothetical protein